MYEYILVMFTNVYYAYIAFIPVYITFTYIQNI